MDGDQMRRNGVEQDATESTRILELFLRAVADTHADRAQDGQPQASALRAIVDEATRSLKGRVEVPATEIDTILNATLSRPSYAAGFEYTRGQVARWYEVPLDEFDSLPMSSLRPDVLFRHIYYEDLIARWFREWGYVVEAGEELEGLDGADFMPDVYAELPTLHGTFQVAVTLFCDNPPNTWRAMGMLESIEAFAPKGSEFGEHDLYLVVTPFRFREQASTHFRIQSQEESYSVVAVEGNDLQDLEHATDPLSRRERLCDMVAAATRRRSS
jgi:hypothetical protein